ncbi:MAG: flagellar biosynthetic protein FliQ [Planctomycetia bacterium]|nr:MAG: flagellar biosynthetic protein FliQ [Planctomycetia bacterium]
MLEMTEALDLGRMALLKSVIIAGPILGIGLVVGIGISVLQTVTQIQDQTVAIVAKIVAMIGAAILFVPWLAIRLIEYTRELLGG